MAEKRRVAELKPDGVNIILVTKANKEEFVLRYVRWVLVDSVKTRWDHFQTGVMRIMEDSSLDLFSPEELELLVVGIPDLDFDAIEKNTKYEGGYDESTEVVKNFWKFVKESVCVCVCTCPPVSRGSVSITRYQSLNLTPR